jgi:hypothetical protein
VLGDRAASDLFRGAQLTRARLEMLGATADTNEFIVIVIDMVNGATDLAYCLPYRLGSLTEALKTKEFAHIDPNVSTEVNVANSLK